jgi:uncharacterized protein (TIGR03086 family)
MSSVVDLDRRAVEVSVGIAARITPAQLTRPTPCAGWNLADLLSHMIAQHYGFAAAAEGNGADASAWEVHPVAAQPSSAYAAAARRVIAAFAAADVLQRSFWLPEIRGGISLRAPTAIGFHLVDYVVHGWDVAAAMGVQADYPPDVVAAALAIAEQVPDDATRLAAGASFQPARPIPAGETPMRRMLLLLGRSPSWPS